MRSLLISLLILSCRTSRTEFSILEFSVASFDQNLAALNSLLDVSYNVFLSDFDLVILKNLNGQEELDLINNRVSFGNFKKAYFISQNKRYSISVLAKETVRVKILSFVEGFYGQKIGVVVDFIFKGNNYGVVIFNFSDEVINNLDISVVDGQIAYLNSQYENLVFILDKTELVILDIIVKKGFFSLIQDSSIPIHIINIVNYMVYSNFVAHLSPHYLFYTLLSYLNDEFHLDNFPKSIVIK
ncbi:hypothetical protein LKV13_03880 [Borrelia sp. BU AG58]|uniref:hypothetical protein n=1 Tax=Borrelia sp. BU AG58 TaxID=2887345 RepID=UPI001E4A88B2|nr:hypothetical protein [Borrelia sp. BU AG58]UER67901.1 hypothetical protein LKV13_03880 [Borrelia sp. BU AG58]